MVYNMNIQEYNTHNYYDHKTSKTNSEVYKRKRRNER